MPRWVGIQVLFKLWLVLQWSRHMLLSWRGGQWVSCKNDDFGSALGKKCQDDWITEWVAYMPTLNMSLREHGLKCLCVLPENSPINLFSLLIFTHSSSSSFPESTNPWVWVPAPLEVGREGVKKPEQWETPVILARAVQVQGQSREFKGLGVWLNSSSLP